MALVRPAPDGAAAKDLPSIEPWMEVPHPKMRDKSVLLYTADPVAKEAGNGVLEPKVIKVDSPRFVAAMETSGIELDQMQGQPKHGPFGWYGTGGDAKKAQLRRQAWDKMAAKNLDIVLGLRADTVHKQQMAYEAALKRAEGGGFGQASIAEQLAEQRSTMIAMAEEAKKATAEAAKRRIADVEVKVAQEQALAAARAAENKRVQAQIEAEQAAQRRATAARRKRQQEAAVLREKDKAYRFEEEQISKESKLVRFEEAERVLQRQTEAKRKLMRKRQLAFAKKHARKIEAIAAKNVMREEARVAMGEETVAKLAESEAKRVERVRLRQEAQAIENAERAKVAEERLRKAKMQWAEEAHSKKVKAEERTEEVAVRLHEKQVELERSVKQRQEEERREAIARKEMLEEVARRQVLYQGQLASAADAKERVIEEAQRRKQEQLLVRAEESRLKFATKRCFVDRKKKMEHARRRKAEEACEDKAVLSDGVIAQKREYVQMRRQMAMEGQFEMSVVLASAKQRPTTAPTSPSAWELRATELKSIQSELSLPPSASTFGRGELSVAAPSTSNGWIGRVEASTALRPNAHGMVGREEMVSLSELLERSTARSGPGGSRRGSTGGLSISSSSMSMSGSRLGGKSAPSKGHGSGALVGKARLGQLQEEDRLTKSAIKRVRSRGNIGDGWRLYAPGLHVGLSCETKQHLIDKDAFANGKYSHVQPPKYRHDLEKFGGGRRRPATASG